MKKKAVNKKIMSVAEIKAALNSLAEAPDEDILRLWNAIATCPDTATELARKSEPKEKKKKKSN